MLTVTIKECSGEYREWTTRHKTESEAKAIVLAVRKQFGSRAGFYESSGLRTTNAKYGQIGHPVANVVGLSVMDTGRVSIRIEGK